MKKILILAVLAALALTAYAEALEYTMEPPDGPDYGKATSIEVVHTRDNGERKNTDISKNAALIPPGFGTPTADLPGSGEYLTPNLAPEAKAGTGTVINGSMSATTVVPPAAGSAVFAPSGGSSAPASSGSTSVPPSSNSGGSVYQPGSSNLTTTTKPTATDASTYTDVTEDLYYKGGYLGRLEIPVLDLSVKIFEGTGSSTLAKGVGHFEDTSIWGGNVCLASHNRGANNYFGKIHTLKTGDQITYTTQLGTRTYEVFFVGQIEETDFSRLERTSDNLITLVTCVRDVRNMRWCVQAREVR